MNCNECLLDIGEKWKKNNDQITFSLIQVSVAYTPIQFLWTESNFARFLEFSMN